MNTIISKAEFVDLRKHMAPLIERIRLSHQFPPDVQDNLESRLMETIITTQEPEILLECVELSFKLANAGYSEDIQISAINLLGMIRDNQATIDNEKLSLLIFTRLRNLALPKNDALSPQNLAAQSELIQYLNSPIKALRKHSALSYLDHDTNPHANLLRYAENPMEHENTLLTILDILSTIIKEEQGPHSLPGTSNKTIKGDDVLVKLHNQFGHGQCGMYSPSSKLKQRTLDTYVSLGALTIPEKTKHTAAFATYIEGVTQSANKYLIKLAQDLPKIAENVIEDRDTNWTIMQVSTIAQQLDVALGNIQTDRLKKAAQKAKSQLTELLTTA